MTAILALTLGCLALGDLQSAEKPTTLLLEQTTTLHVGEKAMLKPIGTTPLSRVVEN